jgi:hypothetical protein
MIERLPDEGPPDVSSVIIVFGACIVIVAMLSGWPA